MEASGEDILELRQTVQNGGTPMATMLTARRRLMLRASGVALALLSSVTLHLWAGGAKAAPNTCKKGFFPASGKTQPSEAELNDDISGPVPVPDDGAVQAGRPLAFRDNGDGTITDLNTGLMWEKKGTASGLHDVDTFYVWSGDGSQETIWDWLADVNAEDGVGFAGYNDWRIPNAKELGSITDYGQNDPAVTSAFNSSCDDDCTVLTCSCSLSDGHWSSTTLASPVFALAVDYGIGETFHSFKTNFRPVRAVRGGCTN